MLALLLALQTTTAILYPIDLLGPDTKVIGAELDGNPATQEWLVDYVGTADVPHRDMIRTAQQRAGGVICVGPWHDPRPVALRGLPEAKSLDVQVIDGRTRLEVSLPGRVYWLGFPQPPTTCQ